MQILLSNCFSNADSRVDDATGPLVEYNARVEAGRIRNDDHQRGIVQSLQRLHDQLLNYDAPPVTPPSLEDIKPKKPTSMLSRIFRTSMSDSPEEKNIPAIPENLPQGLYLYGDVGSGKTMLMDLFFDTLPSSVHSKTRIHFHNFMQDVHKRLHKMKMSHGSDVDAVPFVAAEIATEANVLCFDEFQCTDVADAMILRRLLEALMAHGVVLVTTSNRHPNDLYKNGIQRESFVPCIELLKARLTVINLDSPTDYRKVPRPSSGIYFHTLGPEADAHADKWFHYLGTRSHASSLEHSATKTIDKESPNYDEEHAAQKEQGVHSETQTVWGRKIHVPKVLGKCAQFSFEELIGSNTSAADYIELCARYEAFVVVNVPGMTLRERDRARRFITFIDAVYERRRVLVLTTSVGLGRLFASEEEVNDNAEREADVEKLDSATRLMMDDLGMDMKMLKNSSLFSGDEERFAFARALSRLTEMGSVEWVERGKQG